MSNVDKIQSAGARVEEMQSALATVHSGLEHVESVAVAAEEVRRRGRWLVRLLLLGIIVTAVVIVLSRRKRRDEDEVTL